MYQERNSKAKIEQICKALMASDGLDRVVDDVNEWPVFLYSIMAKGGLKPYQYKRAAAMIKRLPVTLQQDPGKTLVVVVRYSYARLFDIDNRVSTIQDCLVKAKKLPSDDHKTIALGISMAVKVPKGHEGFDAIVL